MISKTNLLSLNTARRHKYIKLVFKELLQDYCFCSDVDTLTTTPQKCTCSQIRAHIQIKIPLMDEDGF